MKKNFITGEQANAVIRQFVPEEDPILTTS